MANLRSKKTTEAYDEVLRARGEHSPCPLCPLAPLKEFVYWKIVSNDFPYDRVASLHHMIIPKRHGIEHELTPEERAELLDIKHSALDVGYDDILEPTPRNKSVPGHFHLHLIIWKDEIGL